MDQEVDVMNPLSGTSSQGENQPACMIGMMVLPIMRYYEETGDPVAADLVRKFSHLVIDLMPQFGSNIGQVHSSLSTVSGILKAGRVLGIPEYVDWAENVYTTFTSRDFIPSFGWSPENTARPRTKGLLGCETCTTIDDLELAVQLALSRDEKYWDRVEQIAMNQLLEGQLLRLDFIERVPSRLIQPLPKLDSKWYTADQVLERNLGGFSSFCGPNDWVQNSLTTVQCCFGSGARGLYDIWYFSASEESDLVRVNLQFSKRLPSAVVTSYMPGEPVVEVEMNQQKKLLVRKPAWAAAEECRILVNGKPQPGRLKGTYFDLGSQAAGTTVRIEFPDKITHKKERIGELEFATTWRGNAVVRMEPIGEIYPLYQNRDRTGGVKPLPFINRNPVNPL